MYRRHTVAIVGTVLVLAGCSSTTDPVGESAPPTTESATTTALLVTAVHPPVGLLGSDGKQHVEYDLVFPNVFGSPVTLTGIDVRTPEGTIVLTMDRDQIAATTQPVFVGPASAEIDGPELAVDKQSATVIASPVRGAGWWNANSCCVASTPHHFSRLAVGGANVKKFEEFVIDSYALVGSIDPAEFGGDRGDWSGAIANQDLSARVFGYRLRQLTEVTKGI